MKLAAALLVFGLAALRPAFGQAYTLTDLGLPPGYTNSSAKAINSKNEVTGEMNRGTQASHAFLYHQGQMTDLGTLPECTDSVGNAINSGGWIAGSATKAQTVRALCAYAGKIEAITVPGSVSSVCSGLNSAGQIVGDSMAATGETRAFLAEGGHAALLDDLVKGKSEWKLQEANAINDHGAIVGVGLISGARHAFLFHDGVVTDLNQWGKEHAEWVLEQADGINDKGDIVCIGKHGPVSHVFLLLSGGTSTDLGALPDYPNLNEAHLNNRDEVVGQAETASGTQQCAFLYTHGKLIDLNCVIPKTLHWSLEEANAINDSGVIVGTGEQEGKGRAFLLKPKEK